MPISLKEKNLSTGERFNTNLTRILNHYSQLVLILYYYIMFKGDICELCYQFIIIVNAQRLYIFTLGYV